MQALAAIEAIVKRKDNMMGVEYELVNISKKERITFTHLAGSKRRELAGNPAQAAVTTWYLLTNQGDNIQFVSDSDNDWPFSVGKRGDQHDYPDKTFDVVSALIQQGILEDVGYLYQDEEEPETVFVKNIVNVWMDS